MNGNNDEDGSDLEMAEVDNAGAAKQSKGKKRLSVERIYQKKTQLEHILLRYG